MGKKLLIFYLVFVLSFIWGLSVVQFKIFPYKILKPFGKEFVDFLEDKSTSSRKTLTERIKNDLDIFPSRHLHEYKLKKQENFNELNFKNFKKRRTGKLLYKNDYHGDNKEDYLLFHGFIDFEKTIHGAFLITLDGKIINYWKYEDDYFSYKLEGGEKVKKSINTAPHGLTVFKDGSILFQGNDTGGSGLRRISFCGKNIWSKYGSYHHSLSKNSENNIWVLENSHPTLLDLNSGEVLKKINFFDIAKKNRDLGIFSVHQDLPSNNIPYFDPWHINDVEPLNIDLGKFKKDDLLISYRNSNLIFIIDQKLNVKWWKMGATRRQHDPDWSNDLYITVFDNSMRDNSIEEEKREFSRVLKLNLINYNDEVIYDGEKHNAYSVTYGKHQILPNNHILVVMAKQGRVLIVDENKEKKFELINKFSEIYNGNINNAIWIPKNFFDFNPIQRKCYSD